jgi:hypothetical protein
MCYGTIPAVAKNRMLGVPEKHNSRSFIIEHLTAKQVRLKT